MAQTVDNWIAYAALRGDTVADDAASAAALVRAQDYLAHHYLNRVTVTPDEAVLDAATYEAAKLELATPGFFSKTYTPAEQKVLVQVDGIKWETKGDASGSDAATPVSTKIEAMMRPYMAPCFGAMVV